MEKKLNNVKNFFKVSSKMPENKNASVLESGTVQGEGKEGEEERKFRRRCQTSENKACVRAADGGKSEEMAVWVSTARR